MIRFKRIFFRYLLNFRYAFCPHKPLLVLRLIKNYLGILFFKKMPLRYIDFAIDYRCNLNCEHCFATALLNEEKKNISVEQFRSVAKEAMRLGAVNFSFQGGEPTMFQILNDYIKAVFPWRNLISVTTNATLLDEKRIKEFKKLGVDILTISLDSGIPEEHDRFRGVYGTFNRAYEVIILAIKNGLKVTIGATISHRNIRSKGILELIELANRLNVILFFALAAPLGRWAGREDIILTGDDKEYLMELLKKYPLLRTDFEANYINNGCGAVKEILYITPYGDVLACPFIHISLGNIMKESINTIRGRGLKNNFFNKYYNQCLAAEEGPFMKNIISRIYGYKNIPVPYSEVFADI